MRQVIIGEMSAVLLRKTGAATLSHMNHWIIRANIRPFTKQTGLAGPVPINGKMELSSSTVTHDLRKSSGLQFGAVLMTLDSKLLTSKEGAYVV